MNIMENKIIKTELVEWEKLKPFQPVDLKKMSKQQLDKIKASLKNNDFKSPFYVWEDKEILWVLDGHHRLPVLKLLKGEGENIPEKLPASFINCKNKKEAKKAVLLYNSHYADIQKNDFFSFFNDLEKDDILNEFNFDNFFEESAKIDIKEKELKPYDKYHILISYTNNQLVEIQNILEQLDQIPGIEIEQSSN